MQAKNYLEHKKLTIMSNFFGTLVWVSLATFMIVAKNEIGVTNIPIFELLIFIASLVSTKFVYDIRFKVRTTVILALGIESVFLIGIYWMLMSSTDLAAAGIAVYMVIITNAFTTPMRNEADRCFEDQTLQNKGYKRYIRKLRKQNHILATVGATVGSMVSLFFITYLEVDLRTFTMWMLLLNVLQNGWDYYLWVKYLK